MRLGLTRNGIAWSTVGSYLIFAAVFGLTAPRAKGAERQFLVILANSPKQYPNPNRDPQGQPPGGLINRQLIHNAYFDKVSPSIGSFAEYWEEISYGDVQVSGATSDWINLPWAIQPPLIDASRDNSGGLPPVTENMNDINLRNSPSNWYDLNLSGSYNYGAGEPFNNSFAAAILDLDGDQTTGNVDNGPFFVGPGSGHTTAGGFPVWKPGERYIDYDDDGRWDGLDEANNQMDWDGDGQPDLRGPWIDLNRDNAASNPTNCVYLPDDDNDGWPNCCPNGPGEPGCEPYHPLDPDRQENACPPTQWESDDGPWADCNGNLIPDACDISASSAACTESGYKDLYDGACPGCGQSEDIRPFEDTEGECLPGAGNDVPDECEFINMQLPGQPVIPCITGTVGEEDGCFGALDCLALEDESRQSNIQSRCEFDDSNGNEDLDIVEPFENFLRRWDPCAFDPDVEQPNFEEFPAHWVKVYDPLSPNAYTPITCSSPEKSFIYADPSYILDNYPGKGLFCSKSRTPCETDADCPRAFDTDFDRCTISQIDCEFQSSSVCPLNRVGFCSQSKTICSGDESCLDQRCDESSANADAACTNDGQCSGGLCELVADHGPCIPMEECAPANRCISGGEELVSEAQGRILWGSHHGDLGDCVCSDGRECLPYVRIGGTIIENACPAGFHMEYDPPDEWENVVTPNGPDGVEVHTTKMQHAGGRFGEGDNIEPVCFDVIDVFGTPVSVIPGWYEQAWEDRYEGDDGCPNPQYDPRKGVVAGNEERVACEAPPVLLRAGPATPFHTTPTTALRISPAN